MTEQSQECRFGQIVATKRNFAYFFGGSKKDGTLVNDDSSLLMYNLQSYEFIKLGTPDAPIRKYHAAALVNDKIFIFGTPFPPLSTFSFPSPPLYFPFPPLPDNTSLQEQEKAPFLARSSPSSFN